eukprot:gene36191-44641_t
MSAIESVLVENRVFPPAEASVKGARISGMDAYNALCNEAAADFEGFWARLARENVVWTKPFTRTLDESKAPFYQWFDDGELNASANCLDKHIGTPTETKTAIIFEADDGAVTKVTYKELLARVSQFANALKAHGVAKGDRVLIVDDLIATGGTAGAAIDLVRKSGGEVVAAAFVIELPDLGGAAKLKAKGVKVHTLDGRFGV